MKNKKIYFKPHGVAGYARFGVCMDQGIVFSIATLPICNYSSHGGMGTGDDWFFPVT